MSSATPRQFVPQPMAMKGPTVVRSLGEVRREQVGHEQIRPEQITRRASRPVTLHVDLHMHSTASDGTDTPTQLVHKAKRAGLSAIALTDHDTVAGVAEARDAARRVNLDFVPGIEVSASYPRPGVMHLLGYGIDIEHPALSRLTANLQDARAERNAFLIDRLQSVGIDIDHAQLRAFAGSDNIGRPHFAKLLFAKGYIPHVNAAYRYYLGNTGKFRFDRREPEPAAAIAAIHEAGGVVSLAHPIQLRKQNFAQLANEIKNLADAGLDGVECIYNDHRESFVCELKDLCRRFDLLQTGGSDYHGGAKKWITLGRCGQSRRVPRKLYDRLLERLAARRRQADALV
ncbi:MAG: PHP domain-containing protein [Planctomycetota bacterium]